MKSAAKAQTTSEADFPVLVAISGGRDSIVMLHWLISQGQKNLILCHLNHALRGRESGQDAALIRRLAKQHALPCEIQKRDVAAFAKKHQLSLETAGRQLRHDFLFAMAAKHRAHTVFLAHHADDQAETILANLCRGSSIAGLSGMAQETQLTRGDQRLTLQRPLLEWRRAEIDAYITQHQLIYREDSSNSSLQYRRNRLRHQVLPLLNDIFERDVAPIIARLGRQAQRDDAALSQIAAQLSKIHISSDGSLLLTPALRAEPPAVLSRLLQTWLVQHLRLTGIETADIDAALSMLHPGGPAKVNLPKNRHLRRKAKRLWVESSCVLVKVSFASNESPARMTIP
jgi:tRNA(Ile)-lysidine synthase